MLSCGTFFASFRTRTICIRSRIALQTIDGTFTTHVLANFATQTGGVARCVLMLSFGTFFASFCARTICIPSSYTLETQCSVAKTLTVPCWTRIASWRSWNSLCKSVGCSVPSLFLVVPSRTGEARRRCSPLFQLIKSREAGVAKRCAIFVLSKTRWAIPTSFSSTRCLLCYAVESRTARVAWIGRITNQTLGGRPKSDWTTNTCW